VEKEVSLYHQLVEHPILVLLVGSVLVMVLLSLFAMWLDRGSRHKEEESSNMSESTTTTDVAKSGLWQDRKFQWLIASVALVAVFEFLSLMGDDYKLRRDIAFPFFAALILAVGWRTLWSGLKALSKLNFRSINLLMTIAVVGAFYLGEYEEAAVVVVLFALGERLESFGIQSSKSALQALVDRTPKTARVRREGGESEMPIEEISVGDTLILKPSDMIALDAEVISGASSVDESAITGEPLPKDKHTGDRVFAGTLNMQGYLEAKVLKTAKDTTLAKIIETTFAATKTKADTQKFIETFAGYYTPSIIAIATLLVIIPTVFLGQPLDPWFEQAITILVIACPCSLVISTPISIYAAIGNASAKGALVKGGKYIEAIGRIKAVAMDKTRTLTYGKPKVTDVLPFGESTRQHLLACAAGIESYSEHPLAAAVVAAANEEKINIHTVENFQAVMGKGAKADCIVCYDKHHCIGKLPFITEEHEVQEEVVRRVEALQKEGKTSIVVSSQYGVEGVIALTDEIKTESRASVAELQELGIEVVMMTGDNRAPAEAVAKEVGIREVKAEMLPEDKAEGIKELLAKYGPTAMVGDGVNDAPALALSSVGVAMGAAGSDTAIEAASIAILNDRLELIPYLVRLGRRAVSTIRINTVAAIATKLVFVVLAILGLSSLALAIFADVGVTVLVILNSLRLLSYK
jgi:Cd2+/Zn2+-exporting ATPase